jgi:hypothetical protein
MATSSSLIKTTLHKSLAEGIYRDVTTKSSSYYYFLGRTLEWTDATNPPYPIDSYSYERAVRDDIITLKSISPSDVSFVIPRVNWTTGNIYDMYDDQYSTEVQGISIVNGGTGFTSLPVITVTGGGGTGAKFYPIVYDGSIIGIEEVGISTTSKGSGYTSVPTVTVTGGGGTGAVLKAIVNIAPSGSQKLETCQFYVMTEDYNVYKCLDNNNNSSSTAKPLGTSTTPVLFSDGYVWKFMYNVPINLRNKFLSDTQMPVVSALTNQFYSNGSLDSIVINNKGSGYTTATIAISSSDGYRKEDPTFLNSIALNNSGGNGYISPTVTFGDPVTSATAFIGSSTVFLGQRIYNSTYDFYEVVTPGLLSSGEPTHRYGIVQNNAAALNYIGSRAKGTVTTTGTTVSTGSFIVGVKYTIATMGTTTSTQWNTIGGTSGVTYTTGSTFTAASVGTGLGTGTATTLGISGITLSGGVREIDMVAAGSGYLTAPAITFSGGSGSGAVASAKMNAGAVIYCTVTNQGDNYTSAPTVTFGTAWAALSSVLVNEQYSAANGKLYTVSSAGYLGSSTPTHVSGTQVNSAAFAFSTALTLNSTVYVSTRLYKVTTAGTTSVGTTPTHTTGTVTNGTAALLYLGAPASLTYAGVAATATSVLRYGYGYSAAPSITIVDSSRVGTIAAQLSWNTSKSEAKLLPIIDNGQISGVIIENPGTAYSTALITVSGDGTGAVLSADLNIGTIQSLQANNEILTSPGTINAIKITSGGYGYGVATISITGDGTGATATATLDSASGAITKINITNPGQNYTFANVSVTGNGQGANLRAIMCPYGGHGKNAPNELFATTLMFYSNVSTDLNQGVSVNNDYRQIGIIKNPNQYNSDQKFQGIIGSACFIVSGTINTTNFPKDTDITVNRTVDGTTYARKYRIVSSSSTSALLQSLDNDVPVVNDTFSNIAGNTFSITNSGAPTVDKYSGQLMFIDNKAGFTPSDQETVTLRTVIGF